MQHSEKSLLLFHTEIRLNQIFSFELNPVKGNPKYQQLLSIGSLFLNCHQ